MTHPIYAVGDIHGQMDELARVLDLIAADGGTDAEIVFVGDYIDRGPDSAAVLDTLIAGLAKGRKWHCLKGNHDRMFEWFLRDIPYHDPHLPTDLYWLHPRLGGDTTLASYGVTLSPRIRLDAAHAAAREAVPQAHIDFLRTLPVCCESETAFFAHAGIRPNVPLADQCEEDLVWIRKAFHAHTEPHPKLIVHGHTPVESPTHYGNRVNIDAGAGHGKPLAAIVLEGAQVWQLCKEGRRALDPA